MFEKVDFNNIVNGKKASWNRHWKSPLEIYQFLNFSPEQPYHIKFANSVVTHSIFYRLNCLWKFI